MHPRDTAADANVRRLEALLANLNFTVAWEMDAATRRFTFVSRRATLVTGFPPEEWLDDERFLERHVHPACLRKLHETLDRVPDMGEIGDRLDHRFVRADGQVVWLHTGAVLSEGEFGPVLHGVSTDVTPLKTAEQNAVDATRARDEVLAAVAHDLRTPLSLLQMNAQLLLRAVPDTAAEPGPIARRMADTTVRAVDHMLRIVGDLLDSYSLDAGNLRVEPRPQALSDLTHDALEWATPLAEAKGLSIGLEPVDPSTTVLCDRGRVLQVFANLLGNAIKFTDRGRITVGADVGDDEVALFVRDTGPGIGPERLARIWERGFKADRDDRRGAGLGLFLTRRLIEAQGGRAWVESSPAGSVFRFTLPRAKVPSPVPYLPP